MRIWLTILIVFLSTPAYADDIARLLNRLDKPDPIASLMHTIAQEEQCLSQVIFYEAGIASEHDKTLVAEVILNRLDDPVYPKTICGIVYQKNSKGCQFSWVCDDRPEETPYGPLWKSSQHIADQVLNKNRPRHLNGARFFHDNSIQLAQNKKSAKIVIQTKHFTFYDFVDKKWK